MSVGLRASRRWSLATLFGGLSVDIPLDPLGMNGCAWHVLPILLRPTWTDGDGRAARSIPSPFEASLVGLSLEFQWATIDVGVPYAVPVTVSNALVTVIGS